MCCVCAGTCGHVGNHSYCYAHGGPLNPVPIYTSSTFDFTRNTTIGTRKAAPSRWQSFRHALGAWIAGDFGESTVGLVLLVLIAVGVALLMAGTYPR